MTDNANYRLEYPALSFSQGLVDVDSSEEELTTCSRVALEHGYYRDMVIVDSVGRRFDVESGTKLKGVGPFWGYNVFLNQKIRVALRFNANSGRAVATDDVRAMVLDCVTPDSGWASREDFDELRSGIRNATSVREIIGVLAARPT